MSDYGQEQNNCRCENGNYREAELVYTNVSEQYADVSLPITLKPYATVGCVETQCCGEPIVSIQPTQGQNCACDYSVTVTQTVCIRIPLTYETKANAGESCVQYKNAATGYNSYCK